MQFAPELSTLFSYPTLDSIQDEVADIAFIHLSSFVLCDHSGACCERGNIDSNNLTSVIHVITRHLFCYSNDAHNKYHCWSTSKAIISACHYCAALTKSS